ncbi:MAG: alcohol dehydrogenase catalytic domain-containing protein [Fibrella sp.]|nr:alcohol dehydrogenase catalytic domain-containing protein [Armatimonadota bacterium]
MPDTDLYADYKQVPETTPTETKRWHLYGAGLENVGKEGKPETVSLPEPGPDEILVRHDAVGICYSDIKIVNLGADHPRLVGRDLVKEPVVMGHEVALTVVKAGANVADKFHVGERFIVQADVYYKGKNLAYGYALSGGMAQYGIVGPEVLEGDEGCYLLPIEEETGYAEAALVEPWACVEAAYHWTQTDRPDQGDTILYLTSEKIKSSPGTNAVTWLGESVADLSAETIQRVVSDDVTLTPEIFATVCSRLTKGSVVKLNKEMSRPFTVPVDVGRVHYDGWLFIGPDENTRNDLKSGGITWFIGAAGPMGQMHVQRALQLPNPPAKIVCTDRNDNRLAALKSRLGGLAMERGVEMVYLNVRETAPDHAALAPDGYDDIVVMVPSIEAIEDGFPRLARNGVMNVFAGVARGTMAMLDMSDIALKNVRIVGTSGSSIEDMRRTRDLMEADKLDTGGSLAAIGGLEAFRDGLDAVKGGRFPGKTVIFPQIENLPLTAIPDLETVRPNVFAKLKDGQFWTQEAEAELLKEAVK